MSGMKAEFLGDGHINPENPAGDAHINRENPTATTTSTKRTSRVKPT